MRWRHVFFVAVVLCCRLRDVHGLRRLRQRQQGSPAHFWRPGARQNVSHEADRAMLRAVRGEPGKQNGARAARVHQHCAVTEDWGALFNSLSTVLSEVVEQHCFLLWRYDDAFEFFILFSEAKSRKKRKEGNYVHDSVLAQITFFLVSCILFVILCVTCF